MTSQITLNHHLWQQHQAEQLSTDLSMILTQMGYVAKVLAHVIQRAALDGQLGLAGKANATGDAQKKLDVISNQVMLEAFSGIQVIAAIASEEMDQVQLIECGNKAQYILCTDPLDGSSNTDTGSAVGTIFGIYHRTSSGYCSHEADALQPGTKLVAAGYILYGTSTVLVYSMGDRVDGFTLDPYLGEFILTHDNIHCPTQGKTYSANLSYYQSWDAHIKAFADYLSDRSSNNTLRYSGALVADVHRCLVEGGLYFYPPTDIQPDGKLRMLYECAPLAYLIEQAGGLATSGQDRILEIEITSIHQRSPLVIGSAEAVHLYQYFLQYGQAPDTTPAAR